MNPVIDIENLGFDNGAYLIVKHALHQVGVGQCVEVVASSQEWESPLRAWCRAQGHDVHFETSSGASKAIVTRGAAQSSRWQGADQTGNSDLGAEDLAKPSWGLAARGATVEAGSPGFHFRLNRKVDVWADHAPELYAQAVSAQWNPDVAVDWSPPRNHSMDLENAVVQIMTYLIENENAALVVPARFLGQLHPHFREVQALLAIQVADEARHIEVFTRRVRLYGGEPALSTVGGQASLKTLVDEPDFSIAGFLLSVLGEGTFVDLLQFLHVHGPDPVTRQIAHLTARDESRHVAFGMSHILYRLERDPEMRSRLARAVEARHEGLISTAGLNEEVFDSLILLASGSYAAADVADGYRHVQMLVREMAEGRRTRLIRLGFNPKDAERLSSLHTRNFM